MRSAGIVHRAAAKSISFHVASMNSDLRTQIFQLFISEFAHKSVSGRGANGYHQQVLLVPEARFATILRHTIIDTNKVARLG
jgi:hypothetical protein